MLTSETAPTLQPTLKIDRDRLLQRLDALARIGQQPSGSICRLAFTPEDLQARALVQKWMREAGMNVRSDAAGNLIGTYAGKLEGAPALATGSHIDTVPSGGRFDGVLGVLAGIEAVQTLAEGGIRLQHPVEAIVFSDEEKTMIGAQAMAGTVLLDSPERYQPQAGGSIQACLQTVGGCWEEIATARRSRADLAAFLELHVEQGAVLEREGKEIGIVQGVVGMQRLAITILGEANHAGTTPMDARQDALIAAAQIVLAVREIACQIPTQPVATVGALEVFPNAVNIVPGKVELSVDMRDIHAESLDLMQERLEDAIARIAEETGTQIAIAPLLCVQPTLAASHIQTSLESICQQMGLSYCSLPSRAGHDALELGRITDMGMIFVPSQAGVSHSEAEYTSPEQCEQGANVLLQALCALDRAS